MQKAIHRSAPLLALSPCKHWAVTLGGDLWSSPQFLPIMQHGWVTRGCLPHVARQGILQVSTTFGNRLAIVLGTILIIGLRGPANHTTLGAYGCLSIPSSLSRDQQQDHRFR